MAEVHVDDIYVPCQTSAKTLGEHLAAHGGFSILETVYGDEAWAEARVNVSMLPRIMLKIGTGELFVRFRVFNAYFHPLAAVSIFFLFAISSISVLTCISFSRLTLR